MLYSYFTVFRIIPSKRGKLLLTKLVEVVVTTAVINKLKRPPVADVTQVVPVVVVVVVILFNFITIIIIIIIIIIISSRTRTVCVNYDSCILITLQVSSWADDPLSLETVSVHALLWTLRCVSWQAVRFSALGVLVSAAVCSNPIAAMNVSYISNIRVTSDRITLYAIADTYLHVYGSVIRQQTSLSP